MSTPDEPVAPRPTRFAADVPAEPVGLLQVRDRDGDLWRLGSRPGVRDGRTHRWVLDPLAERKPVSHRHRRSFTSSADWPDLVVHLGPLRAVEWAS